MTIDEKIALFFKDPTELETQRLHSVLYLARREVQDCLIGMVLPEDEVVAQAFQEPHRLFATVMVVSAATDLLAKMHSGSDANGGVGNRIRAFAERYMFAGGQNAAELGEVFYYGCRNPMLHSFNVQNGRFRITLVSGQALSRGAIWSVRDEPSRFAISVEGLYTAFVAAVRAYRAELQASDDLKEKFGRMFDIYGSIPVFSSSVAPYSETA